MDVHTLHTEAELAHLLRLIRETKASGRDQQECKALEDIVHAADRALKSARATIEDALRRDMEVQDSVNSCIVVASFIAGVQTQLISLTHLSNNSRLQISANVFGFVGVTLDVIGASTGVLCVILLRRSIERSRSLLLHINEMRRRIYANAESILSNPDNPDIRKVMDEMHVLYNLCDRAQKLTSQDILKSILGVLKAVQAIISGPFSVGYASLISVLEITMGLPGFAIVPLTAIAIGTVCLLTSVLTFAATSQLRGVWVACVSIAGSTLLLMLILKEFNIPGRQRDAAYKALVKDIKEALRPH